MKPKVPRHPAAIPLHAGVLRTIVSSGSRRTALLCLGLAAASLTYGIGIDPYDPLVLPDTVKQSIVRIQGSHIDAFNSPDPDSILGTGTIIDVHQDATGTAGWLCILTADHVAGRHLGAGFTSQEWKVGFGGGSASGTWDIVANSATAKVVRGPVDNNGNRVDLAVLAVRYADVTRFRPVPLAQPTVGESVILAGYGRQATLNHLDVRYDVQPGFGEFRAGPNRIDDQGFIDGVSQVQNVDYYFVGIKSDLSITARSQFPPLVGDGYILNGDSGGPMLATDGLGGFGLVGVHHASQTWAHPDLPGKTIVTQGSVQVDVDAWYYRRFIGEACAAVPEPGQTALVAGIVAGSLLLSRRRAGRSSSSGIQPRSVDGLPSGSAAGRKD